MDHKKRLLYKSYFIIFILFFIFFNFDIRAARKIYYSFILVCRNWERITHKTMYDIPLKRNKNKKNFNLNNSKNTRA